LLILTSSVDSPVTTGVSLWGRQGLWSSACSVVAKLGWSSAPG